MSLLEYAVGLPLGWKLKWKSVVRLNVFLFVGLVSLHFILLFDLFYFVYF